MRNFLVNVNGTQYEVAVEEIDGKAAPKAAPVQAAPVAAPVAAPSLLRGKSMEEIVAQIGPTAEIIERIRPVYNFKAAD